MKKKIIFTGGGSGGHVIPAITLINSLQETLEESSIGYIGSHTGIEKSLIGQENLDYYSISTGKLRRYLSKENIIDIFKVAKGLLESIFLLIRISSTKTIIFSTGGFVSVPVVVAAWLLKRKIYIHEQTSRVGLANKIASIFATKVFISFKASENYFPKGKTVLSGYPLRKDCYDDQVNDVEINGIKISSQKRPVLFVTGGGNGSLLLNNLIKNNLDKIKDKFFIIHQVGKSFIDEFEKLRGDNYCPIDFVQNNMIDYFKLSSVVISRAGAGTVSELIAIGKKSIFIPLKNAQKNEQFHNAMEAKKILGSLVVEEDELDMFDLIFAIEGVEAGGFQVKQSDEVNATKFILETILK